MKTRLPGARLILAQLLALHAVLAQGPLTPPGAPAPAFKTLQEIEPRAIVNSNNTPGDSLNLFLITNSGSYYLTNNLTGVSGKNGLGIAAPNVTLDLNGFSLLGVPGSADGINAANATDAAAGLVVQNGTVANWGGNGINAGVGAPGAQFSRVLLVSNALNGLLATQAVITACVAVGNTSDVFTNYAINAKASRIINCVAKTNYNGIQGAGGSVIDGCVATENRFGILAANSVVNNCTLFNNIFDGVYLFNNNRVTGNLINGNNRAVNGIEVAGNSRGNVIDGNTITGNTNNGILLVNPGVTNNFLLRNSARANATNYATGAGNSFGPIVNVSGVGDISTVTNANHPWANFSY